MVMKLKICILLFVIVYTKAQQFEIPPVKIEGLSPKGFRASIPDVKGIQLFGFHSNLNEQISSSEEGDYWKDIKKATNGRWVYENKDVTVAVGDTIYYWVFVQFENLGYRREEARAKINALIPIGETPVTSSPVTSAPPPEGDPSCNPSVTRVNNIPKCQGQLIFEDTFDSLDSTKWERECRLPEDEVDDEFVSYQNRPENGFIKNGRLVIVPTLLDSNPDSEYLEMGTLDLRESCGCASQNLSTCVRTVLNARILPPVISASYKSKGFSFKYGRVQIRAKLPAGDWIFPELYLRPVEYAYGPNLNSGLMRVAFTRGNIMLTSGTKQIDGRELSGGLLFSQFGLARNFSTRTYIGNTQWTNDFHDYELIWGPDKVSLKVDGTQYGTISAPLKGFQILKESPYFLDYAASWVGERMAPFDKEMEITLGLGVGGVTDFPDSCITRDSLGNDHTKPWKNRSPKALLNFWQDVENWHASWPTDDNQNGLQVDHVRVWAL